MSNAQVAYKAWVDQGKAAGLGEESVPWESLDPSIRDRWSSAIAAVRRGLRSETIEASKARDNRVVAKASSEAQKFQGQFASAHRDKQKAQGEVAALKVEVNGLRTQLAESASLLASAKKGGKNGKDKEKERTPSEG